MYTHVLYIRIITCIHVHVHVYTTCHVHVCFCTQVHVYTCIVYTYYTCIIYVYNYTCIYIILGGLSGKSMSSQLTSVTTPAPSNLLPATPQPHLNHLTPVSPPIHPSQNVSTTDEDDNDSGEVKESLRIVPPVVIPFVEQTQDIELSIETLTPSINPSESSNSRERDEDSSLVTSTETQSERQDIGDSTQCKLGYFCLKFCILLGCFRKCVVLGWF